MKVINRESTLLHPWFQPRTITLGTYIKTYEGIGRYVILIVIMALLAGCVSSNVSQGKAPHVPEHLLLAYSGSLVSMAWDASEKTYVEQAEAVLERAGRHQVVNIRDNIFVSTPTSILKFDETLKQTGSREFRLVKAVAANDQALFVCAEGALIALDTELNELSRAELVVDDDGKTKDAHDIVIYNQTAYLLDNFLMPIFLFRVDISNPRAVGVTERVSYRAVNVHLRMQWLNPAEDDWCVVESTSTMSSVGERLAVFPLASGTRSKARQSLHWQSRMGEVPADGHDPKEEVHLTAITTTPPLYGVINDRDIKFKVVEMQHRDSEISFEPIIDLPYFPLQDTILARTRTCLVISEAQFIANHLHATPTSTLYVVSIGKRAGIVHRQEIALRNHLFPCAIHVFDPE